MFGFGIMLYVSLLMINAVAILNEERFLARIGWLSTTQIPKDVNAGFQPTFDQNGYGAGDAGIKARMVELISAVRTLMRIPLIAINIVVILYELAWG